MPRIAPRHLPLVPLAAVLVGLVAVRADARGVAPSAWNGAGHEAVARIAWTYMSPTARDRAVALLRAAPRDAGLRQLYRVTGDDLQIRRREFFELASTWPDLVRDSSTLPLRKRSRKYHHRLWHYRDLFWEQKTPTAPPADRPDLSPGDTNAVERLQALQLSVADPQRPDSMRAIDLAWIIHLVGDIHQPLHASARVTPAHKHGDGGGNEFVFNGAPYSLHSYWDGLISRVNPSQGEGEDRYAGRVAALIIKRHPRGDFTGQLSPADYDAWARAGYDTAKRRVYVGVKEGPPPSPAYRDRAYAIAEPAVALAGYRLAELLDTLLK